MLVGFVGLAFCYNVRIDTKAEITPEKNGFYYFLMMSINLSSALILIGFLLKTLHWRRDIGFLMLMVGVLSIIFPLIYSFTHSIKEATLPRSGVITILGMLALMNWL